MTDSLPISNTFTEAHRTNDLKWNKHDMLVQRWVMKEYVDGKLIRTRSEWMPIPRESEWDNE